VESKSINNLQLGSYIPANLESFTITQLTRFQNRGQEYTAVLEQHKVKVGWSMLLLALRLAETVLSPMFNHQMLD
jgi:hypothetical protein